ncbi:MAG TPA: energy transducer TonB [Methylophilus sp.]
MLWALACSVLLHALVMLINPHLEIKPQPDQPKPLTIELVQPKAVEAPPVALPEPPKPQPPEPTPEPTPLKKVPDKIAPKQPKAEPLAQPQEDPTPALPTPEVVAVAPTPEVKPAIVVPPPPPEPPPVSRPSEGDISAARDAFRSAVQSELKRNQRYPRIAEQRGIEGDVDLEIRLDDTGNVTGVTVVKSSGSSALDDAAIAAVKRSNIKQYMRDILRGLIDKITLTVGFKLAE